MRRVLPLALLAALAATAAVGCGGATLDPVAQAASKTADAGSFRFSFSVDLGIDLSSLGTGGAGGSAQQSVALTGSGAYDKDARRLQASLAVEGQTFEMILDASESTPAIYLRPPAGEAGLPAGKTWARIDLAQAAKQGGFDLGALTSAQLDPRKAVELLKEAGASARIGEEQIDGVATTHYRVVVDPKTALGDLSKSERQQAEQALKLTGISTFPVDVWVDGAGMLRRVSADLGGGNAFLSIKASLDLTDYGTPVTVDLPPADQVETAATSFLPLTPKS
ncbi:MAG TPA: hypothetical protein VLN26_03130 [Gaiellaceae bacterium]|nr:hypothetical protein [Gaiellaceae bacterium]